MSKKLLRMLNAGQKGLLDKWISDFKGQPRIHLFLSSGNEFGSLIFFSNEFSKLHPPTIAEPKHPDIFLMIESDTSEGSAMKFPPKVNSVIDDDEVLKVVIKDLEELPNCRADSRLHPQKTHAWPTYFMNVQVQAKDIEPMVKPVIFIFGEDIPFVAEMVLPNKGIITHITHYSSSFARNNSTGGWLWNILDKVKCKVIYTDAEPIEEDEEVFRLYPELKYGIDLYEFENRLQAIRWGADYCLKIWAERTDEDDEEEEESFGTGFDVLVDF